MEPHACSRLMLSDKTVSECCSKKFFCCSTRCFYMKLNSPFMKNTKINTQSAITAIPTAVTMMLKMRCRRFFSEFVSSLTLASFTSLGNTFAAFRAVDIGLYRIITIAEFMMAFTRLNGKKSDGISAMTSPVATPIYIGVIKMLKRSITAVMANTDAARPASAPFIFFLYLYINAQTVENVAVERMSISNPQNPVSPIDINSRSATAKEIESE